MYDLAREFLQTKAPEGVKDKAHTEAGNIFAHLADGTQEVSERLNFLVEAIHHFANASSPDKNKLNGLIRQGIQKLLDIRNEEHITEFEAALKN